MKDPYVWHDPFAGPPSATDAYALLDDILFSVEWNNRTDDLAAGASVRHMLGRIRKVLGAAYRETGFRCRQH